MVSFLCYYCDKTLKKKQADNHQCKLPKNMICITCHKTFLDN